MFDDYSIKEFLMVSKLSRGIVPVVMAILLVAAVAHVASSNSGGGAGHMGHPGFRHGGGMDVVGVPLPLLLKTANLTDSQKQQIHAIFQARRASRKAEMQQLKAAKEAIAAKYTSTGSVAASDLSSSVATITQLHDQMTNEQVQDAISIRNVLTSAQLAQISATKAKLDSIHAEMKALWAQSGSAPSGSPTDSSSSD
jgi:Spy/CpxP family protein refolding chaperone